MTDAYKSSLANEQRGSEFDKFNRPPQRTDRDLVKILIMQSMFFLSLPPHARYRDLPVLTFYK